MGYINFPNEIFQELYEEYTGEDTVVPDEGDKPLVKALKSFAVLYTVNEPIHNVYTEKKDIRHTVHCLKNNSCDNKLVTLINDRMGNVSFYKKLFFSKNGPIYDSGRLKNFAYLLLTVLLILALCSACIAVIIFSDPKNMILNTDLNKVLGLFSVYHYLVALDVLHLILIGLLFAFSRMTLAYGKIYDKSLKIYAEPEKFYCNWDFSSLFDNDSVSAISVFRSSGLKYLDDGEGKSLKRDLKLFQRMCKRNVFSTPGGIRIVYESSVNKKDALSIATYGKIKLQAFDIHKKTSHIDITKGYRDTKDVQVKDNSSHPAWFVSDDRLN